MLVVLVVLSILNMGILLMASAELTRLTASVAALRSADVSLIALVTGLAAQIRTAVATGDSGALTDLADSLDNETAAIVAAVKENTVAETTPGEPDVPTGDVPSADVSTSPDVLTGGEFDNSAPQPNAGDALGQPTNTDIGTTSAAASSDTPVNEPGNAEPAPSDVETGQPQPTITETPPA